MTRNKYAALSFIPVTAARHDFGDASQRRKRNLAFSFVFRTIRGRASIEQRRRRMTQPASSWHCRSGYMMPAELPQQSYPTYYCCCFCFCHCSHVEPIFSSSPSSSSLSTHFCARSTFKALNIIHYNAVHSRLLAECGKCRICTSPPLSSPLAFY